MTEMFDRKSLIFRPSNNKIYLPPGPFNAKRKPWIRNVITLLSNGKSVQKRGQNLPHFMFPFSSAVVKIRQTCRLQLLIEANVCVTRAGLRSDPGNTALG